MSPQDQGDPDSPKSRALSSTRIFISYRREDSEGHTGRLYDALANHFGAENVFMDIDTIPLGVDFAQAIEEEVGRCDVLIAVIGRQWLTIADPSGERRLDNPDDFVRLEIKAALKRDVRVIPALIQDTGMPRTQELPRDITGLAGRNGIFLHSDSWSYAVDRLIGAVEDVGRERGSAQETSAQPVAKKSRATDKQTASSPTARAPKPAQAKPSALIGTWTTTVSSGGFATESGAGAISTGRGGSGMSYEFDADGNYVYGSFFDIAIANETIAIYETGAYGVENDTLTFTPTSKSYKRNGVEEGDQLTPREFKFRLEPNLSQDGTNLVLVGPASEDVFTKG